MKTNETGRSMVEMLGVLAIIGVLSIGGIAGYTMAMNRYRANEVIDMATKYAVIAYTAQETHKAMNGGQIITTGDHKFEVPSFEKTGLASAEAKNVINGVEIGDATVGNNHVDVTLDFKTHQKVCYAAASALGYSPATYKNGNEEGTTVLDAVASVGTEDCANNKIYLRIKQS